MSTITRDDVAAFEDTLKAIDQADDAIRDLADRLRRKEDAARVAALRGAIDTLGRARRVVERQLG